MSNNKEYELFRNIVIKPKEGDERTFEEYEATMTYDFFRKPDELIDNPVKGREYVVYGCNTDDGELAVLVYGFPNDLDINYINDKPIADRVKMHGHKGFQIECVKSDERLFNSGETYKAWFAPFTRYIASFWDGYQYDIYGQTEANSHGLVKLNYIYDYVWFASEKNTIISFSEMAETWNKITDDKYDYYILWINQGKDRE